MGQTTRAFSRGNEAVRLGRISVKSICMYLCLGITYHAFYLHPNLRPRSKECTFAHVDLVPSASKRPGTNKIAEKLSQPPSTYSGAI